MKQDCTLEMHFLFVRSIIKRYSWELKTKEIDGNTTCIYKG